ncbi:MAG TPA: class I SAM-dependent methyltransferase [Thermomicrobiales bacterium]
MGKAEKMVATATPISGSATVQGVLWSGDAQTWADLQEPTRRPLWTAMLDAAGVGPGTRLLDAGCGAGGASRLAADRGARIGGLDAAPAMIEIARERILTGDFRVGELQELPYADGSFDVVFACNAVQYATDPVAALREFGRVCSPDDRVVVAIWAEAEKCEYRDFMAAIRDSLPTPPAGGGPFALSAPGVLEGMVEQAGLTVIATGKAECPFEYPNPETAWIAGRSGGPVQGALRQVDEATLRSNVLAAIARYRTSTGAVRIENAFRIVTARP